MMDIIYKNIRSYCEKLVDEKEIQHIKKILASSHLTKHENVVQKESYTALVRLLEPYVKVELQVTDLSSHIKTELEKNKILHEMIGKQEWKLNASSKAAQIQVFSTAVSVWIFGLKTDLARRERLYFGGR